MFDNPPTAFDTEIDKLTNSIENAITGETFNTEVTRLTARHEKLVKKKDWLFDWKKELRDATKQVYKLTTESNQTIIQGLLSIEDKSDHLFMHLLESARFNKGQNKIYVGAPGNLVAYACKLAFEKGYDGFVAFDSKTALVEHYRKTLGATLFRGQRMYIETQAASVLVTHYFKNRDHGLNQRT